MFCSNCGFQNSDDSKFCAGCGAPINSAAQTQAQTQNYQQTYQPQYQPAMSNNFMDSIKSYQQPENAIAKTPFPAYILKFIRMGIWLFYFLSIFFAWFSISIDMSYFGKNTTGLNLFNLLSINEEMSALSSLTDMDLDLTGVVIFAVIILLVLLGVVAIQVMNNFTKIKVAIPQIILCAAPAIIALIFIIVAFCSLDIAVNSMASEYGNVSRQEIKEALKMIKEYISMGPGFGAWLVFILSAAETALYFVYMRDKNAPIMQ